MKRIPLRNRQNKPIAYAVVDDADFELVAGHRWRLARCRKQKYARMNVGKKSVYMHSLIAGVPRPDHRDGNGLNNTRENLRPSTASGNGANCGKLAGTSSRYKGVSWYARDGCWMAKITKNGKAYSLGYAEVEEDAALLYDVGAQLLHGEFARLNRV